MAKKRDLLIATPAIYELSDAIDEWVEHKISGAMVYGHARFGKSCAIEYLQGERINRQPTACFSCLHSGTVSENGFYEEFLSAVEHADFEQGNARQKRRRLINFLETLAGEKQSIVVFLDDAQELAERQLHWLCDVYNGLDKKHIDVCFVLVGDTRLLGVRDGLLSTRETQIVGRFMTVDFDFFGVRDIADMETCLNAFDEESQTPGRGGNKKKALSQQYFPKVYATGWRLAGEKEAVYQAFEDVHSDSKFTWPFVIPMKYLVQAVLYMLKTYSCTNHSFTGFMDAQWVDAVKKSGYEAAGQYMRPPPKRRR